MSYIETIPVDAATDDVRDMYQRQQSAWGFVPNYAKSFSHRPEVMARWGRLLAELKRPMSLRRFELVTFAAAVELRHSSCALAHGRALSAWFGEREILAIANGESPPALTAAEREIVAFARQVARDAAGITAEDVARLHDLGISDGEVFDIAAVAAGRAFFTKVLDSVGSLPDADFLNMPRRMRAGLAVGKPIETREVQVMKSVTT